MVRIAVACKEARGLDDYVHETFAHAPYFLIADVEGGKIVKTETMENSFLKYEYGVGPAVSVKLVEMGVKIVIGAEFGPGVKNILQKESITMLEVKEGTRVEDAIKEAVKRLTVG